MVFQEAAKEVARPNNFIWYIGGTIAGASLLFFLVKKKKEKYIVPIVIVGFLISNTKAKEMLKPLRDEVVEHPAGDHLKSSEIEGYQYVGFLAPTNIEKGSSVYDYLALGKESDKPQEEKKETINKQEEEKTITVAPKAEKPKLVSPKKETTQSTIKTPEKDQKIQEKKKKKQ